MYIYIYIGKVDTNRFGKETVEYVIVSKKLLAIVKYTYFQ